MNSFTDHDGSRPDGVTAGAEADAPRDAPLFLVTGGTGTLGRPVVHRLLERGHRVRVLSRGTHAAHGGAEHTVADLDTGEGVAEAVAGAHVVLHLAGTQKGDAEKTQTLVDAIHAAGGRPHLVFVSVVGADRVPVTSAVDRAMFGYFASKRGAELVVEGSGLPWTTLRATQFHDLILATVRAMAKLPVAPVPSGVRFQPVGTDEVAARLVDLAEGDPSGLVDEFAGPRAYPLRDLVRSYLEAAGKHRLTVPMPVPGGAGRAIKAGANLAPDHAAGRVTWEAFLADRLTAPAGRAAAGQAAQMTP